MRSDWVFGEALHAHRNDAPPVVEQYVLLKESAVLTGTLYTYAAVANQRSKGAIDAIVISTRHRALVKIAARALDLKKKATKYRLTRLCRASQDWMLYVVTDVGIAVPYRSACPKLSPSALSAVVSEAPLPTPAPEPEESAREIKLEGWEAVGIHTVQDALDVLLRRSARPNACEDEKDEGLVSLDQWLREPPATGDAFGFLDGDDNPWNDSF